MFERLVRKATTGKHRSYIFKYLTDHKIKMCFNFIVNEEVLQFYYSCPLTHFKPVLHFIEQPVIWFAMDIKWQVSL